MVLSHWVKAATDPNQGMFLSLGPSCCLYALDYQFAQFNIATSVFTYSQDEYNRHLLGTRSTPLRNAMTDTFKDNEWSKEETDYLFSLAREYDARFYIIHDRYDFPDGKIRTIEVCSSCPTIHILYRHCSIGFRTSNHDTIPSADDWYEIDHGVEMKLPAIN